MSQISTLSPSQVFVQALNAPKPVFGRDSAPDPAGGAYDAPPDAIVGWEGTPSFHFEAFGSWILRPLQKIPGYDYELLSWPRLSASDTFIFSISIFSVDFLSTFY